MRPELLEVPSYPEFGQMRLGEFVPAGTKIVEQSHFEWMGGRWLCESIGFTWFGRLMSQPDQTAELEVFFEELDETAIGKILRCLRLPVNPGMTFENLRSIFGWPKKTDIFASDRKTYSFQVGRGNQYQIRCTVEEDAGLIHLSVIRSDVLRKLAEESEQ